MKACSRLPASQMDTVQEIAHSLLSSHQLLIFLVAHCVGLWLVPLWHRQETLERR